MKPSVIIAFILILISSQLCIAQTHKPWSGFGLELNTSVGKIIRHTKKFPTQLPNYVTNYELNFIQQTYGTKPWQQRRRFPLLGFAVTYTNYGIDSIYGQCLSIYPNVQIPLVKIKNFEWTIRAGFGLGFITKKYVRYPSYDTINTAIGSYVNNYTHFSTDLRYRISPKLDVQVGGNFSHISNASYKFPNLGINAYGAHVGIRYFPVNGQPEKIERKLNPLKNRWLAQARLGFTTREIGAADGPSYPVYNISLFASKRYWSKNKVLAGVDYSYHAEVYHFLRNNEILVGEEKQNSWRSSIFVGNEFLLGRVGILFQLGYYIKNVYLAEHNVYQKLGGNVYLIQREQGPLKEMFFSILLKSEMENAELVELGLGLGF